MKAPERLEELRTLLAINYPIYLVSNETFEQIKKESQTLSEKSGMDPIVYDDFYTLEDLYKVGAIRVKNMKLWTSVLDYGGFQETQQALSEFGIGIKEQGFSNGHVPIDVQFVQDIKTVDPMDRQDLNRDFNRGDRIHFEVDYITLEKICYFYNYGD